MVAGRPRTVSPPPEECIKLGEELVAWATYADTEKPKKDDKRLHLKQWWALQKSMVKNQWDTLCELKEFVPYYEKAQAAIAIRYIDGTVNPSIAQRFLRLYFADLKKEEDTTSEFNSKLKNISPEDAEIIYKIINYASQKQGTND